MQALSTLDSRLKENDAVIFIDRKGRRYMKMLRAGKKLLIRGELRADDLFGVEEGSRVKFSTGEAFLVLRPTYADRIGQHAATKRRSMGFCERPMIVELAAVR